MDDGPARNGPIPYSNAGRLLAIFTVSMLTRTRLAHEADDVLGIVRPVGIALDAGAFVLAYLVLVDHPPQRR